MRRKNPSNPSPELFDGISEDAGKQKGRVKRPTPRMMADGAALDKETLLILRTRCAVIPQENLEGIAFAIDILDQVERPVYEQLHELFERMGGTYIPGRRIHGFPFDPTPMLALVREEGSMLPRNPLDFFRTTPLVLEKIRNWLNPEDRPESQIPTPFQSPFQGLLYLQQRGIHRFRILEPSAGDGVISELLRELFPTADLWVCEKDPYRCKILEKKGFHLLAEDFLTLSKGEVEPFDLIVMNPPFQDRAHGGAAYIAHIRHAFSLLRDHNSQLITVAPAGFLTDEHQPYSDFLTFCLIYGLIEELPRHAFKESGTTMKCVLIWIDQEPIWPHNRAEEPCNGYANGYVSMFFDHIQWEETYADLVSHLLDQMVTGELIVYTDGRPAEATRQRIIEACQEISNRERRKLNHLPIRPQDYGSYIEEFLVMLEDSHEERADRLRTSFREKRQAKWQLAVQTIESLQGQLVKINEHLATLRQELQAKEALLVKARTEEARLGKEVVAAPEWDPPTKPAPPVQTCPLELLSIPS